MPDPSSADEVSLPGGVPAAPPGNVPPSLTGHGWSRGLVALALVLALVASGIGLGIGYAIHGTAPGSTTTATTSGGTPVAGTTNVSAIAGKVAPALVDVYTTLAYRTAGGAGTGMVVTSTGLVITNNHVIAGATSIKAIDLGNGKTYTASILGYDVSHDVAVLQLQGASGLPTATVARSAVRVGTKVVAVGNAGGNGPPTAAAGVVTGLDRAITALSELSGTTEHLTGLIETDAAIQSGQSGGALVNRRGRVVGMVTAGSSGFAVSQSDSRGYAVPAQAFGPIVGDIVAGRASATVHVGATAILGVRVMATQTTGAFVVDVMSTSPAATAGIAPGDRIVGLSGQPVRSPDTVSRVLAAAQPGTRVHVDLVDPAGQARSVTVVLVAGPPA